MAPVLLVAGKITKLKFGIFALTDLSNTMTLTTTQSMKFLSTLMDVTYSQLLLTPLLRYGILDKDTFSTHFMDMKALPTQLISLLTVITSVHLETMLLLWPGNLTFLKTMLSSLMTLEPKLRTAWLLELEEPNLLLPNLVTWDLLLRHNTA